jgi:CRP-like cAMP-binding protein
LARDGHAGKRVAALARGTVVGEISVLEAGTRSATVLADENVTGWMIDKATFESSRREHPRLGGTILANIARELALRLHRTSQAFGAAVTPASHPHPHPTPKRRRIMATAAISCCGTPTR